jgi:hypothetical protein
MAEISDVLIAALRLTSRTRHLIGSDLSCPATRRPSPAAC